jgi:hypothetical protein
MTIFGRGPRRRTRESVDFHICDQRSGRSVGFQITETAEDREKGKKVFSRVALPAGISREEVEMVRSGWPQSARHRQRIDGQVSTTAATPE